MKKIFCLLQWEIFHFAPGADTPSYATDSLLESGAPPKKFSFPRKKFWIRHCRKQHSHKYMNAWSQVIRGFEFSCTAAMQCAYHVLQKRCRRLRLLHFTVRQCFRLGWETSTRLVFLLARLAS